MPKSSPVADDLSLSAPRLAEVLRGGAVVAYPCEGVWGLGCDPRNGRAVRRLLALKGRPESRGLILIAADSEQLLPYLAVSAADQAWQRALAHWPGPMTCLLPAAADCPTWLSGEHQGTLAVRVSDHGPVLDLCRAFGGALVSTSANPFGQSPARSRAEVRAHFGDALPLLADAEIGDLAGPTPILDAVTGRWVRGAPAQQVGA